MEHALCCPCSDLWAVEGKFGLRACMGRLTSYVTFCDESKSLLGVTYLNGEGQDFVFATGNGSTWFRTSWPSGKFRPEIRCQWRSDDTVLGVAITYCGL